MHAIYVLHKGAFQVCEHILSWTTDWLKWSCTLYQRSPNHRLLDHYLRGHLKNNAHHQPNFCTKEDLCPKIIRHIDGIHAVSDLAVKVWHSLLW